MSTYLYMQCLDHDPPLVAEGESGQHLYDLPDIRADIANRDALVAAVREHDMQPNGYFRSNTLKFLAAHPTCRIGIVDEYDKTHPLTGKATDG